MESMRSSTSLHYDVILNYISCGSSSYNINKIIMNHCSISLRPEHNSWNYLSCGWMDNTIHHKPVQNQQTSRENNHQKQKVQVVSASAFGIPWYLPWVKGISVPRKRDQ